MLDKIKRLGTETAIYGISTILGRFLNFLLVPLYTNVLTPHEYGIATYVFSLIAFMNIVYGYGMESAYFRYTASGEIGTGKQHFSTPFIALFVSSSLFSLFLLLTAENIATVIELPPHSSSIIHYASWILFFDTLVLIPFASLRLHHKAGFFAFVKFLNILITVTSNIVLLVIYRMGLEGIFLSNLIASGITLFILLPTIEREFSTDFSSELLRALLKFGLPVVPAGLAAIVIQVVDRPILRMLTDDPTVGIYQANYRLGIFMMLIVQMFEYAWRPFFLSNAKEPNAKDMFSRILTYFVLLMTTAFLLLSLFLPDIVKITVFGKHIIHPDYWPALGIVPIILLGYMLLGIYNNVVAGVYIEKKTQYLPIVTFIGAGINIAANFLLIPSLHVYGAALATLLSYCAMAVVMYTLSQRVYPVPYEWKRLLKIAAAGAVVAGVYFTLGVNHLLLKTALFALFCLSMFAMKFFNREELVLLRRLVSRSSKPPFPAPEFPSTP